MQEGEGRNGHRPRNVGSQGEGPLWGMNGYVRAWGVSSWEAGVLSVCRQQLSREVMKCRG